MDSAPAMVALSVVSVDDPPFAVANAGPLVFLRADDTNGMILSPNNTNALVLLDASGSHDSENDPLQFFWFADGATVPMASGVLVSNWLEVGTHTIRLLADDGHDTGSDTLTVVVTRLGMALEDIGLLLNESSQPPQRKRPLLFTLKAATASFERGNFISAIHQLHALQNKIRAQIAPDDPVLGANLTRAVQRVIDAASLHFSR